MTTITQSPMTFIVTRLLATIGLVAVITLAIASQKGTSRSRTAFRAVRGISTLLLLKDGS